jgi:hypothetical protein
MESFKETRTNANEKRYLVAIEYTVIGASGTAEESLLIQIDVTASVVQRSRARMSSNKRKSIHSDRIRKLEDRWNKRTGKK